MHPWFPIGHYCMFLPVGNPRVPVGRVLSLFRVFCCPFAILAVVPSAACRTVHLFLLIVFLVRSWLSGCVHYSTAVRCMSIRALVNRARPCRVVFCLFVCVSSSYVADVARRHAHHIIDGDGEGILPRRQRRLGYGGCFTAPLRVLLLKQCAAHQRCCHPKLCALEAFPASTLTLRRNPAYHQQVGGREPW